MALAVAGMLVMRAAGAHHSFAEFDQTRTVEISGTLRSVAWQNPHVHFTVESSGKLWDIESHSVSILRRTNVTPEALVVGSSVKVAGNPSKRSATRMFGTNLLTAKGTELVFDDVKPRWNTKTAVGLQTTWNEGGTVGDRAAGLFRVWSSKLDDPQAGPRALWRKDYPLTPAAQKKVAAWNPVTDTIARGCAPKGMPTIMEEPYPIQFVKQGDTAILLRMEEYDTVRTIDLQSSAVASPQKSLLGYSRGRWEGETLVVTTTHITWPWLDPNGVPLGPSAMLVERFTPNAEGTRLDYTLRVTDADTFTQPIELKRRWVWRPGESVKPYNCQER